MGRLNKQLRQVMEFHETFKHPVRTIPTIIDRQRALFRAGFLQEELDELTQAILDNDIVEIADALIDLQYVLDGTILEYGLTTKKEALFNEVHASNMSKACKTEEEAQDYIDLTTTEVGPTAEYEVMEDGKVVLYSTELENAGKVLKGPHYFKPNLKDIIYE